MMNSFTRKKSHLFQRSYFAVIGVFWLAVAACGGSRHFASIDYNAYNFVEHKPSRASGSTLGWRYGPGLAYRLMVAQLGGSRISVGAKYAWFNSTSRRVEIKGTKEDPTNPNDLWIKTDLHFFQPSLSFTIPLKKYHKISVDGVTTVSYNRLFAGRFTPRHIQTDGKLGSKFFPSANFNSSHGRLRGGGWKIGLGLLADYELANLSTIGVVIHYDMFDNTVVKEYFGSGRYSGGELVYKPKNAFSVGLKYTF